MDKIEKLINHKSYINELNKIAALEINREFCRHSLEHSLDVARIAYIISLENDMQIPKELIYAAALLHDIGRGEQYSEGVPHNEASADISRAILDDIGFTNQEKEQILNAIYYHSNSMKVKPQPGRKLKPSSRLEETSQSRTRELTTKSSGFFELPYNFCDLLYKADKLSRVCFHCSASEKCNWDILKKNNTIIY